MIYKPALTLRFLLPCLTSTQGFRSHIGRAIARNHAPLLGLFNHTAEGKNRNQTAMIRFAVQTSGSTIVGCVHALDEEAMQWVTELDKIQMPDALANKHLSREQVAMSPSVHRHRYRIQSLVVAKNASQYHLWQHSAPTQKLQRVQALLHEGFARQCEHLALTPTEGAQVHVIEHEWSEPKLTNQQANAQVRLCDALFTLPAQLLGSWAAGPLNNRGHGLIDALEHAC